MMKKTNRWDGDWFPRHSTISDHGAFFTDRMQETSVINFKSLNDAILQL